MSRKPTKAAVAAATLPVNSNWEQLIRIAPYSRELGLEHFSSGADWCVLKVPYAEKLIGYPETRILHGGVITALMDVAFGLAIFVRLGELRPMATLDLRIDYLKPATPDLDVLGGAVCYKLSTELAFVRGCAYHDTPEDPIATSIAIFMFTGGPVISLDGVVKP